MTDTITAQSELTPDEFDKLSRFIDRELGIKMPDTKKIMLESRLQKRLKNLQMKTFKEYCSYLFSDEGKSIELPHFFNVVTTNKTDFFREAGHFDYMRETLLPRYLKQKKGHIRIWSCACSSGEEPYTIAIVLEEFFGGTPSVSYQIEATDISTKVLEEAVQAVYRESEVAVIPYDVKRKYFLRGKGENRHLYKVKPSLRSRTTFSRLNLMDRTYPVEGPFDIIFCRNVLIYFDRPRQEEILRKISSLLTSDGVLFLGHSESMAGMSLNFKPVATAVYQRPEAAGGRVS